MILFVLIFRDGQDIPSIFPKNLIKEIIVRFMFIKDLNDCEEFIARDNSILRELLHPDKQT